MRCSIVLVLLFLVLSCKASPRDPTYNILSVVSSEDNPFPDFPPKDDPFPDFPPKDDPFPDFPPHVEPPPTFPPPERHYDDAPPPPHHLPPPEIPPPPPAPKPHPPSPPAPIKPPPAPDSPAPSPSHEDEEKSPPPPPHPHRPEAILASLTISNGKLVPKFSPDIHKYSATVDSGVKKIRITAVVPEEYETEEYTITINNIPVKSGAPSPQLSVGKTGKSVVYEISVTLLEHESSTYYVSVMREKSKWERFGTKFLLALAIILIVVVAGFLCYGCYLCIQSGRIPAFWPFTYLSRDRSGEYSSLSAGPSHGRP